VPAAERDLALLRARMAAAGSPLYLGAGTAGPVLAPPEQAVLVLGPPRSGKTTSLVIPNVLAAPGPVVTTSTKPDVLLATARARAEAGRCWLWDPSGTVAPPPGVTRARCSPVPACRSWEVALLTARALTGAARPGGWAGGSAGSGDSGHWLERAEALLAPLLHAAAVTDGGIRRVVQWVHRRDLDTALGALGGGGAGALGDSGDGGDGGDGGGLALDVLSGVTATDSRELSGIWSTAAGILAAYRSAEALAAADDPNLDPLLLALGTDTVFVCAPARHQALVAPLVVGFVEQVRDGAYAAATTAAAGGRRPGPPVTLALDEVANIAPLPDLPAIVAEGGSQGLHVLACLQDLSQARARWGPAADGFLSLFGVKVILPGIGDLRTLELVAQLGGEVEVPVRSVNRSWGRGRQGPSVTVSSRRQRWLPVDAVAHMPPRTALVLDGARPPARLRLTPWQVTAPFAVPLPLPPPAPPLARPRRPLSRGRQRGAEGPTL
jgi:type IV secretion system protein VirD4